jgi:hypothetical protein
VNIGSRDNFDWMSLKDYLKETLDLGRDDVFKVDVKEGFSFFNTDPEHTDKVMEVLNNVQLEGRRINVEISKMMVAEDVITTEEVLVVVVLVAEEVLLQEEQFTEEKVQAVVEATETQVLEKVDLVEEALLQEKEVLAEEVQLKR